MNPESPLSKLPSISELLKHPTVDKVVQRINQTTVAQRATGFLAEFQAGLLEKRDKGILPSLGHLAERLAQRLLGQSLHTDPVINASGLVCSDRWQPPLAEGAIQEMMRAASDYHSKAESLQAQVADLLQESTGAESAWVTNNYQAAVNLIEQCEMTNAVRVPFAGLLDPAEFGLLPVQSLRSHLQAGVEVLICDGGGLLGGPSCGIVLGKQSRLAALQEHDWAKACAADALTLVALSSTLSLYHDRTQVTHQIPVWQLLTAPLENLKQRAERIAPLLDDSPWLDSVEPVECESPWFESPQMRLANQSWAIALTVSQHSCGHLAEKLENVVPRIMTRQESGQTWIDLRSVLPRWDQQLVEGFQPT